MVNFGWDYPPGVTGNEPQITGEDFSDEKDPCDWCGAAPCECEEWDNMAEIDAEEDR